MENPFSRAFEHAREWTSFSQQFEGWLWGNLAELNDLALEFQGEVIWNDQFFDEYDSKLQVIFVKPSFELAEALHDARYVADYDWCKNKKGEVVVSLITSPTPYPCKKGLTK